MALRQPFWWTVIYLLLAGCQWAKQKNKQTANEAKQMMDFTDWMFIRQVCLRWNRLLLANLQTLSDIIFAWIDYCVNALFISVIWNSFVFIRNVSALSEAWCECFAQIRFNVKGLMIINYRELFCSVVYFEILMILEFSPVVNHNRGRNRASFISFTINFAHSL